MALARIVREYRDAAEALLDAITVFETRFHTKNEAEHQRLEKNIENRQTDLDKIRRKFEKPEDLRQRSE
jgi:hypothetical protein